MQWNPGFRSQLWALAIATVAGCSSQSGSRSDSSKLETPRTQAAGGVVLLPAVQDTSVSEESPNTNFGTADVLRVNRALVQFDEADLAAAVGPHDALISATLHLELVGSHHHDPGPRMRGIMANRMTKGWTELGATWNCAIDENTANRREDCSGVNAWWMDAGRWRWFSSRTPWNEPPTASAVVARGQTGDVELDVTEDVRKFLLGEEPNHGWILKSNQDGITDFASRETSTPPRLVLAIRRCDPLLCDDGNVCTVDACAAGECVHGAAADGTACDDGNACTKMDRCVVGACTGGGPVACAPLDACHVAGSCDPQTGACANPAATDGTPCNDGNACTHDDRCQAGACSSGSAVACAAADGCHPGLCDPATGACSNPLSCHLYGVGSIASTARDGLVSPTKLEDGTPNDQVGGFGSAISYTGQGNLFVAVPDRGPSNGDDSYTDRYYLIDLALTGGVVAPSIKGAAALSKGPGLAAFTGLAAAFDATNSPESRRLDPEGVRVSPRGTLFVSDEYGPFLNEFSADGDRLRSLPVPDKFLIDHPGSEAEELPPTNTKGRQANRGMEGLAISPDGSKLYGILQSPLIQDGALDASGKRVGTNIRLLEVDVESGQTRELLYQLSDKGNGVNEILAVNEHEFLVLERDGKGGASADFKRLFLIDIDGATDVSHTASLPAIGTPQGIAPARKVPFLDMLDAAYGLAGASFPEKIEGLAFGPDLPDGRHVLVITSDNDFLIGQDSKLFVFAIDPAALPGFLPQKASLPTACGGASAPVCVASDACHLAGTCNPGRGMCSTPAALAGTLAGEQTGGDCRRVQCDGAGNVVSAADDADLPVDDNPCTTDTCAGGAASHDPVGAGVSCDAALGKMCDGAGACVQCLSPADCPPASSDCVITTCTGGTCGVALAPAGLLVRAQIPGDCHASQCDGAGSVVPLVDDGDVPVDGNPCTADLCSAGIPSNPPVSAGLSCGSAGLCDGNGVCVGCITAADCPGQDTACGQRACTAGACGFTFVPADTPTPAQISGDCRASVCDGDGGAKLAVDDADIPVDGNACTIDVCTAGIPSHPALPYGTSCTESGGQVCDGNGSCVAPTIRVLRVGDGSSALTNAATAVFVDERKLDGTLVGSIALPTSAGGANQPFTMSGSASSEGSLSLSEDGRYLTISGYAAPPGTAAVASSKASLVKRAAARLDASGAVDTSTLLATAFDSNNVRAATSSDGSGFWVAGAGGATGGVWYVPFGSTGGTQIVASPNSVRWLQVFGGQLYATSNSNPNSNVFTVSLPGSGLPTSGPATVTSLFGMPTSGSASPFSFVLFDRDPAVPGADTLYVADDRAAASGGGVQKWTWSGSIWKLVATFNVSQTPIGFRGLAGTVMGTSITLIATTADAAANRLVVFVDDGSPAGASSVVAIAGLNTAFRGVALSPR